MSTILTPPALTAVPDATGHFGPFGGMFVPETLMSPLQELTREWEAARQDPAFRAELDGLLRHYVGRPSPSGWAAPRST